MNKRQFLKTSGAFAATSMLAPFAQADDLKPHCTNWAGNLTYHARQLISPRNIDELRIAVRQTTRLRALGSRHSFNAIADSAFNQISLVHLDSMEVDAKARTLTVGAGVRYGTLAPFIDAQGFAVHNLASLPHITVIGAANTATHGSGVKNGNLSTTVSAIEFVTADGELVTLSRKDPHFLGAVVALGAIGVVSRVTLDLVPRFDMAQTVYQDLSFDQLEHNLEAIMASAYSVSLFTDWQRHRATQVWLKRRIDAGTQPTPEPTFYGARLATTNLHPLTGHSAENCTEQLGVPGPWYERLPHFRMNFTPSSGAELQTEYFVPRNRAYEAILAIESLRDLITPHLFITELRSIAADDLWMSMAHQQDSLAIHFTWKPETTEVTALLPLIEERLAPFGARPHWAKLFTMPPARLRQLYPQLPEFQTLLNHYDPHGKFRNDFVQQNIFTA